MHGDQADWQDKIARQDQGQHRAAARTSAATRRRSTRSYSCRTARSSATQAEKIHRPPRARHCRSNAPSGNRRPLPKPGQIHLLQPRARPEVPASGRLTIIIRHMKLIDDFLRRGTAGPLLRLSLPAAPSSPSRSPAPAPTASRSPLPTSPASRASPSAIDIGGARRPRAQRPCSGWSRRALAAWTERAGEFRRLESARRRRARPRHRPRRPPTAASRCASACIDVEKQASLGGVAYALTRQQLRTTAHRIADFIYEKLTGEKGVFSTRIAYVVKSGGRFELQIADADGMNAQAALASREPIISPAWSPDGNHARLCLLRERRSRWSTCMTLATGQPPRGRQLQGLQLGAGLVARRHAAGRGADQGRRLAALLAQCRRQRRAPPGQFRRHRHRAALLARRPVDLFHLRPRRQPADLPHAGRRRRARSASPSRAATTSRRASARTARARLRHRATAAASSSP